MRHLALLVATVALCSVPACTLAKISGRGTKPLLLNNPTREIGRVQPLKTSEMVVFDYTSSFDISEVAKREIAESDADAVANLVVTVKADVGTFFVNLITLGLAYARRVEVTGDLVTYKE